MALETVSGKYDLKKVVKDKLVFSVHHPLLPRRYVPAWQLDMKNRGNISQNCAMANAQDVGKGHVSTFWCGRERLCATNRYLYSNVLNYTRTLYSNSSPFSKYNSTLLRMTLAHTKAN